LGEFSEKVEIADIIRAIIQKSLKSDFRDFKKSSLPVMTPHEAIGLLENGARLEFKLIISIIV